MEQKLLIEDHVPGAVKELEIFESVRSYEKIYKNLHVVSEAISREIASGNHLSKPKREKLLKDFDQSLYNLSKMRIIMLRNIEDLTRFNKSNMSIRKYRNSLKRQILR